MSTTVVDHTPESSTAPAQQQVVVTDPNAPHYSHITSPQPAVPATTLADKVFKQADTVENLMPVGPVAGVGGVEPSVPSSPGRYAPAIDLYQQDYERSPFLFYYYRWLNPWIRILLIIPILYGYAITSGILTYRNDSFQDDIPGGAVPDTRPIPNYLDPNPFILRDVMFDLIPAQTGAARDAWLNFSTATLAILNATMLLMMLVRRDIVRLGEYVNMQMILFFCNAIVHVMTSYPDAGGVQDECTNRKYHVWGNWVFYDLTTEYCGDMMWSGHTANTLLPIIMIRRMMWDHLGWNFSGRAQISDSQTTNEQEMATLKGAATADGSRPVAMDQSGYAYSNPTQQVDEMKTGQTTITVGDSYSRPTGAIEIPWTKVRRIANLQNYSPAYAHVRFHAASHDLQPPSYIPPNTLTQDGAIDAARLSEQHFKDSLACTDLSTRMDNMVLRGWEDTDINMNIYAYTGASGYEEVGRDGKPNVLLAQNHDNDKLLTVNPSPYHTPIIVQRHRYLYWLLQLVVRIVLPVWLCFLMISLILVRFHYTDDILVALLVNSLVACNTHLLQWFFRMTYRPYYHNYRYKGQWWRPMHLTWPLSEEQINLEERIRRIGLGGLL